MANEEKPKVDVEEIKTDKLKTVKSNEIVKK